MSYDTTQYSPGLDISEAVFCIIFDGCVIEKDGVSICDLRKILDEYRHVPEPMIQVDYRDFSEIYSSPKLALKKFVELVYVR
jgi:hypothetical protein